MLADEDLPIIEVKADRTMIYPQRMELTGEESLIDLLQMFPELMIAGYEDVLAGYNLRIDNCPFNGDTKLIISQMKARDIAQIHVCDNAGVAKGVVGMNKVLDINMQMPDTLQGFVEGQGGFGSEMEDARSQRYTDIRDNVNACVIYTPDKRNQIQLGYYRKYYDPLHTALFMEAVSLSDW